MADFIIDKIKSIIDDSKSSDSITIDITNESQPKITELQYAKCKLETQKHIENVRKYLKIITDKLTQRGIDHDSTKLQEPEIEGFSQFTNNLANIKYGSNEYQKSLDALKSTLEHHYANNKHHPEHFTNGINDMNLIDIIEMFCDWKASTLRTNDGNLIKSIDVNADRFDIDNQLKQIFINTAKFLDE